MQWPRKKRPEVITFFHNDNPPIAVSNQDIDHDDDTIVNEGVNSNSDTDDADNDKTTIADGVDNDPTSLASSVQSVQNTDDGTASFHDAHMDKEEVTYDNEGVDADNEGVYVDNDDNEKLDIENVDNGIKRVEHVVPATIEEDNTLVDPLSNSMLKVIHFCMNKQHVKSRRENSAYKFTNESSAFGLDKDTPIIEVFLHTQTAYVKYLTTYNNVNTIIQYAAEHLALTQLGTKTGITSWGQQGVDAIMKEMKKFHNREVVKPLLSKEITPTVKVTALSYLMFLKQKENGVIKGRGCADDR